MTIDQFNELYKILSTLPIERTDNVNNLIYTTTKYQGKTYLIHEDVISKVIFVGYHCEGPAIGYGLKFSENKYFIYHNLHEPAYLMLHNRKPSLGSFWSIHGKVIGKEDFPNHPLVLLEQKKDILKTKIASL